MKYEIEIPTNIFDVTLNQYQKFMKIEDPDRDDFIQCFFGLPQHIIDTINLSDIDMLCERVAELLKSKPGFRPTFELNGVEYGFIPNLDKMSYGEYKDIVSRTDKVDEWHRVMSVMYRPIKRKTKEKYLIKKYEGSMKYANEMKQAPLGVMIGALIFFYDLANELVNYIQNSVMKETKNPIHSFKNGALITKYCTLLEEISSTWIEPQDLLSTKHLHILRTPKNIEITKT